MTAKKDLKNYEGPDRIVPAMEMAIKFQNEPEYMLQLMSGIPSLDQYMGGFRDGELITISGYTKNGKTLLAQTLTANFIKQKCFPLWFSYEVPTRQFLRQFPTVPHLFLPLELKANAMDWLEDRILEALQKFNCRCVFIDHLHFLFDLGRSRNPSLDIGQVIRRLKGLTIKHEIIIFLLCHTQQPKEGDEGLSYEKIRDSSFVAQESDSVIMIARTPEKDQNYAVARVEFHRRTGVMKEKVYLKKAGWWLTEREDHERDEDQGYKKHRNGNPR
jgi:replicative DNA helicase